MQVIIDDKKYEDRILVPEHRVWANDLYILLAARIRFKIEKDKNDEASVVQRYTLETRENK